MKYALIYISSYLITIYQVSPRAKQIGKKKNWSRNNVMPGLDRKNSHCRFPLLWLYTISASNGRLQVDSYFSWWLARISKPTFCWACVGFLIDRWSLMIHNVGGCITARKVRLNDINWEVDLLVLTARNGGKEQSLHRHRTMYYHKRVINKRCVCGKAVNSGVSDQLSVG